MYQNLAIIFLFGLFYSILAGRLERTAVNGAVVYVAFGAIFGPIGLGLLDLSIEREGIRLTLGCQINKIACSDTGKQIEYVDANGTAASYEVDAILVAVGRAPNVQGLNLEAVGVEYDERRVDQSQDTLDEALDYGDSVPIIVYPDGRVEEGFEGEIG